MPMEMTGVRVHQALAVKHGLKACLVGMRVNSAYTPTNCLRTASRFTDKKYKRGKEGMKQAIRDLDAWIDQANTHLRLGAEDRV